MWPRKRLDISWFDIAAGRWAVVSAWNRERRLEQIALHWREPHIVALSVRSALHLILSQADWPRGTEILMSAMTIPDMAHLVRHHGYVPVPVDLNSSTAAPSVDSLEMARTPSTRVLILAHLFGSRASMPGIMTWAEEHNIQIIEDCAQAYIGPEWPGTPGCLATLFSFGTIKTATAGGGAIAVVRDPAMLARMATIHDSWPVAGRIRFSFKLARLALLKFLSYRPVFAVLRCILRLCGLDFDRVLNRSVRGFPGDDLVAQIAKQPSTPLLALLARRFHGFDHANLAWRTELGNQLSSSLPEHILHLGGTAAHHSHWVAPVISQDPATLITVLRSRGFDATQGASMEIVAVPDDRPDTAATIRSRFSQLVFLPLYTDMAPSDIDRLSRAVAECETHAT